MLSLKNLLGDYFQSQLPSSAPTEAASGEATNTEAATPTDSSATVSTIKKLLMTSKTVKIAVIAVLCFALGLLGAFLVDSILTNNDAPHDDDPAYIGDSIEGPDPDEPTPTPTHTPEPTPDVQETYTDEEKIIGTWEYTGDEMEDGRAEYIFADDSTVWMVAYEANGSTAAVYEGVWSISEGNITIILSDGSHSDTGSYGFENNDYELIIGGVVWTRVSSSQSPPELDASINNSEDSNVMGIAAGRTHTIGLRSDGTVVVIGWNEFGQINVSGWSDLTAVFATEYRTVGLRSDGTVVAVGSDLLYGQNNVSHWSDITAVAVGTTHTVGLRSDGTVVTAGEGREGQNNVSHWSDIVAVAAGCVHTVGMKSDGTVVITEIPEWALNQDVSRQDVSGWNDIIAVAANTHSTIGLRSDGTVVATGENYDGELNVSDWSDIIAISASIAHTVGLRSDGTVVAVGWNLEGQLNVSEWRDIIAIAAGEQHTVGLRADGTVVAVGWNGYGQLNVSDWMLLVD
jgi:hypothetical protein